MIQRPRRIRLPVSPGNEGIRRDAGGQFPTAIIQQPQNARLEQTRPTATTPRTSALQQVRLIIVEVFCQRSLRGLPHQFRFQNARRFPFAFLNEFLRPFVGDLQNQSRRVISSDQPACPQFDSADNSSASFATFRLYATAVFQL